MVSPALTSDHWIVQTKLQPPRLRADLIARPRLLEALSEAGSSHRLTLVSAPAGYGKTTLLAALCQRAEGGGLKAEENEVQPSPPFRVAWLSLDEEDNDPTGFLSALIAALKRLNPACALMAQNILVSMTNPAAEMHRVMGVLINDILETLPTPFLLILDDLHTISEPGVYRALDYLLDHMPPHMRLMVGTRRDPPLALARLRSRGELAELRLAELRFTLDEAAALLNERLRLSLSAADLPTLQQLYPRRSLRPDLLTPRGCHRYWAIPASKAGPGRPGRPLARRSWITALNIVASVRSIWAIGMTLRIKPCKR